MGRILFGHKYEDIISVENLLCAWREFVRGKRNKKDVQIFQLRLIDNILALHNDLDNRTYRHGPYKHFKISDPKPRDIHKASVRDRLLHHAVYRKLYPFFDRIFITDSFSCRNCKGTHRALNRFRDFARKVSKNNTKTCFVLKCDIKKFFASINHETLLEIFGKYISDEDVIWLLKNVVESFQTGKGKGLPLGNLTSQLFANVYMNEFDQFVKHKLKAKFYARYADDFVILSNDKKSLVVILRYIVRYMRKKLLLNLHSDKIFIKTFASGVDFLGWIHFSDHWVLRTATKRRMFKKLAGNPKKETVASYLGLIKQGNTFSLQIKLLILNN